MKKIKWYLAILGLAAMLAGNAYADLNDGLVAYYPFNGNANDESGNGNDGTVFGATLTTDRFGNVDSAYRFDGDDWIDVPDDPSFTLGSDPFTIATWIQFDSLGSYYLMGHDEGENNQNKWIFWAHNSGFLFHVNSPSTGGYNPVTYDAWEPEINQWYHLVVKRSGDDFMLYLDGSLVATGADSRPIPDPNTSFQIGTAEGGHPERVFKGLIDDIRIYNRALSDAEIQELYNDGLVAYYPFNGNANDESGNGNDGTVFGATLTTDRFGNVDSAYRFDGDDWIDAPDDPSFTLGSDPFTIATWIQFDSLGSYYLMGHDEGENNQNKWIFWAHNSGFLFHVNSPSTGGYNPVTYDAWEPEINQWYHLVVKRSGDDFMLYLDGSLVATGADSRPIPDPNTSFQIGTAEGGHPERVFKGLIDDIRIYNRALSDAEIQELYCEGVLVFVSKNDSTCDGNFPCYISIQDAIVGTGKYDIVINVSEGEYNEAPTLNQSRTVMIKGGWDSAFSSQTANKTFIKAPKASQGAIKVQMLTVKP